MRPLGKATAIAARRRQILRPMAAIVAFVLLTLTQAGPATASPASLQHQQWWIGRLGLTEAWAITKGAGVTVAVIDTGVDASVGDLHGAVVPGFDVTGGGNGEQAHDALGHGTSMAVKIAGRGTDPGILGVAPQAKVLPVYLPQDSDDTVTALNRLMAMAQPPQVVNMSYGTAGDCPADLQAVVKSAVDRGMILVASAGNEGDSSNRAQYPGDCAGVIAVGAFDPEGKPWSGSQRQPYVSLGGPGVDIVDYTRARTVTTVSGTSDAAAIVSGEFALLRAKFPTTPSRQLVARMFATASSTLYPGPHYGQPGDTLGFGPALVHKALTESVPASAPNPVYDALDKISAPATSAPGSSTSPPAAPTTDVRASFPGGNQSAGSGSSGGNGAVIAIVIVVVIALLVITAFIIKRRRAAHSPVGAGAPPSGGP
jgi:subtilisin family serine protease